MDRLEGYGVLSRRKDLVRDRQRLRKAHETVGEGLFKSFDRAVDAALQEENRRRSFSVTVGGADKVRAQPLLS